jgi:hypothetical protein
VVGDHELRIDRELPDANGRPVVPESLLEPEVEQPSRRRRLDVADGIQIADLFGRDAFAVDLVAVGVERQSSEASRRLEIDVDEDL